MSRSQQPKNVAIDMADCTKRNIKHGGLHREADAAAAKNLRKNRMLIYNEDIDDMLDDPAPQSSSAQHFNEVNAPAPVIDIGAARSALERHDGFNEVNLTLMKTRTPTKAPERLRFSECNITELKTRLAKKDPKYVFEVLLRYISLGKDEATFLTLDSLRDMGQDLDRYREQESTASLLHIALLYHRPDICKKLIGQYPGLLKEKYISKEYRNQTCFHIAAAINDESGRQIMQFMLENLPGSEKEKHELLNTIADGRYFVEERPEAATCLSAAMWTGNVHMISTLVKAGADLDLQSSGGNTLLHNIIYLSTTCLPLETAKKCIHEVYEVCNVWWARKNNFDLSQTKGPSDQMRYDSFCYLLRLRNDSGWIPIALAISIDSPLIPFILRFDPVYKRTNVNLECDAVVKATYDVTDILSYNKQGQGHCCGQYDFNSVLHVLAHTTRVRSKSNKDNEQKDIAKLEPINSAIKMKWSVYRWLYILWGIIHATYMTLLTWATHELQKNELNHSDSNTTSCVVSYNAKDKGLYAFSLLLPMFYVIFEISDVLLVCMSFDCSGTKTRTSKRLETNMITNKRRILDMITKRHILDHFTTIGNLPYRLLAFSFAICMITWYGMLISGNTDCNIPLSLALILGWIFMLNFTRACRHVCRFTIMIQKMFFRDFLYFITVYVFILIAFSSATHLILPHGPGMESTVQGLLNIVTNAGDVQVEGKPNQKQYAAALVSMYAILSVILLLNMLIAMMNTSYDAVKSSNANLWRYQQLSILLLLERRFIWWGWLCDRSQTATKKFNTSKDHDQRVYLEVTEEKMKS